MPNDKDIRKEKKKGLTDEELVQKYEAPDPEGIIDDVEEIIEHLLSKPSPTAPTKVNKRPE